MPSSIGSPTNIEFVTDNNSWTNVIAMPIDYGDTVGVRVMAVARKESNGDCAMWHKTVLFRRDDTDPVVQIGSLLDIVTPQKTLGAALWDFRVRSDSDDYVYFDVKGASGANVGWYLVIDGINIDYPV